MSPEKERELQLRAAAQIAPLGETPLCLRSLSLTYADRAIWFKAILASNATDDDKEHVSCAATEILAAFADGHWSWNEEIVISDGDLDTQRSMVLHINDFGLTLPFTAH